LLVYLYQQLFSYINYCFYDLMPTSPGGGLQDTSVGRGIPGDLCCQLQACVYHHQDGLFHRSPSDVHGIPIQFHKFGSILDKYKKPVVEPWQPSLGEQGHYSDRIGWKFIVTDLGRRNTN
jgi:hypothetical protein